MQYPTTQSDCMVAAQDGPHEVLLWTHVLEMGVWTFGGLSNFSTLPDFLRLLFTS